MKVDDGNWSSRRKAASFKTCLVFVALLMAGSAALVAASFSLLRG